jgi:hypothetical protein
VRSAERPIIELINIHRVRTGVEGYPETIFALLQGLFRLFFGSYVPDKDKAQLLLKGAVLNADLDIEQAAILPAVLGFEAISTRGDQFFHMKSNRLLVFVGLKVSNGHGQQFLFAVTTHPAICTIHFKQLTGGVHRPEPVHRRGQDCPVACLALPQRHRRQFSLGQINPQARDIDNLSVDILTQYIGPGDVAQFATSGDDLILVVGEFGSIFLSHDGVEDQSDLFPAMAGNKHFEPVTTQHLLFTAADQVQKVGVGKDDPALGIETDSDLRGVDQDIAPFLFGVDEGLFHLLLPGNILEDTVGLLEISFRIFANSSVEGDIDKTAIPFLDLELHTENLAHPATIGLVFS